MITVIGLGFVGLTTALGFSKKGFKTYGVDLNQDRLNKLKNFEIPFHEPHLKEVLEETLEKSFFLDTPLEEAIKNSSAIFLCVGTPSMPDGSADLSYILGAVDQILDVDFTDFKVIITKSTVPPSTVSKKVKPYVDQKLKELHKNNIGFASNPEFLREGHCWEDFIDPDRIVIGVEDEKSKQVLDKIYQPFDAPVHYVSYNSAEFIKYLSNTFLATLVSFANEMSMIADKIGDIDVPKAFRVLHEDRRWTLPNGAMSSYVYPGCGYGGYCLPKDTSALFSISQANGFTPNILKGTIETNDKIKEFVVEKVAQATTTADSLGILGLSFKTGSDDVRLTPSKDIIEKLISKGYKKIYAYDPLANKEFNLNYPHISIEYCDSLEDLMDKTNNVLILTAWKEFKEKKAAIEKKNAFDFRYIYS